MPEATMYEDRAFQPPKHYIRFTGQVLCVNTITVAQRMKELSDDHLRLRVLRFDPAHVLGAARRIEGISHRLLLWNLNYERAESDVELAAH